jgi:Tfp pilus assembly protein FimT
VIVATLAAALLAVAAPRVVAYREHMALDSVAHELARDLGRARVEAIKRNEAVTLRRLADTAYQIRADPARRLPPGVKFNTASTVDSVRFAAFGPVVIGAGAWNLTTAHSSRVVTVRASGQVGVQ